MCYVYNKDDILRVRVSLPSVSRLRATPVTRRIRRANTNWPPFEFAAGLHLDDGYRATRVPPLLSHLPTTARASTPPLPHAPPRSLLPPSPFPSPSARFSSVLGVAVPHGKCRIPTKTGKLPSLACFSVGLLPPRGVRCYSFSSLRSRVFPLRRESTERKEEKRGRGRIKKKSLVEQQTYICPVHRYPVTRSCSVLSSPSPPSPPPRLHFSRVSNRFALANLQVIANRHSKAALGVPSFHFLPSSFPARVRAKYLHVNVGHGPIPTVFRGYTSREMEYGRDP